MTAQPTSPNKPESVAAPVAPGRLGQAAGAGELIAYLDQLGRWRVARKRELDQIDAATLRAPDADSYTPDLTLAMAVWQSVSDRMDRLVTVWDSGRAGKTEREEMSRLIWGRLDASGGGLGVSLVEACRLSDALTASLRARLAFDPLAADIAARIAEVRAGLERCADLVQQAAAGWETGAGADPGIEVLRRRLDDLAQRAARGADVVGRLGALEAAAARAERDLIMAAAGRHNLARDREQATARLTELEVREEALRRLAERCTSRIARPPRLGVPDVSVLGPVPSDRAPLDAYRARLETVSAAMAVAEAAYARPLAERDELRGRLQAYGAKARATRREDAGLAAAYEQARAALWSAPCDLDRARELVTGYQRMVSQPRGTEPSSTVERDGE